MKWITLVFMVMEVYQYTDVVGCGGCKKKLAMKNPYCRRPEVKPYDHEAVWECIESLKGVVRGGVTDRGLHVKLYTKMMSLYKQTGGVEYHYWEDPPLYDEDQHKVTYPKWVWSDERMMFTDESTHYTLKPWEEFKEGRVVFNDPFDNTDNY